MSERSIWEALEATATKRRQTGIDVPANASRGDVALHRRTLMSFLDEVDADLTVAELREALDGYSHEASLDIGRSFE